MIQITLFKKFLYYCLIILSHLKFGAMSLYQIFGNGQCFNDLWGRIYVLGNWTILLCNFTFVLKSAS